MRGVTAQHANGSGFNIPIIPTFRMWQQKGKKFKVIFEYTVRLRTASIIPDYVPRK